LHGFFSSSLGLAVLHPWASTTGIPMGNKRIVSYYNEEKTSSRGNVKATHDVPIREDKRAVAAGVNHRFPKFERRERHRGNRLGMRGCEGGNVFDSLAVVWHRRSTGQGMTIL
jgi:hypothetical protein